MTRYEDVTAAWAAVDTATNDMGERVQDLIDEINTTANEGLTGPQTEAVLTNLTALAATLNATARDPSNPIQPVPEPEPIPGPFGPN